MKFFFNLKPPNGSYGGGAFFVKNLSEYLIKNKHSVTYLLDDNIDVIVIIDPRKGKYKKYDVNDILKYKKNNCNVKIIHRVNECDIKRKKSINIEKKILNTIKIANFVIFVSEWLRQYYFNKYNLNLVNSISILNGCNEKVFYPIKNKKINKHIKIVTHHWSNDYMKGFEIYNKIDKLLDTNNKFSFTFIGNYIKNYTPKNINLITPKEGFQLANIIREHDIYLTATQYEPGGAHYIEGMMCGLPVLYYINGGGVKEAVGNAGIEFNSIEDFQNKLNLLINEYYIFKNNINYDFYNRIRPGKEYLKILNNI